MSASLLWRCALKGVLLLEAAVSLQKSHFGNALDIQKAKGIPFLGNSDLHPLQAFPFTQRPNFFNSSSDTAIHPQELESSFMDFSDGQQSPFFFTSSPFVATKDSIQLQHERLRDIFEAIASTIKTETTAVTSESRFPRRRNGIRRKGVQGTRDTELGTLMEGNPGGTAQQSQTDAPYGTEQALPQNADKETGLKDDTQPSRIDSFLNPLSETGASHPAPSPSLVFPSETGGSSVPESSSTVPESLFTPNPENSQAGNSTPIHRSAVFETHEVPTPTTSSEGTSEQASPIGTAALMRNLVLALEEEEAARRNPGDLNTPAAWHAYVRKMQNLQKRRRRCQLEASQAALDERKEATKNIMEIRDKLEDPRFKDSRPKLLAELEAWQSARANAESVEAEIKELVARTTEVKIPQMPMTPPSLPPPRPSHIKDISYTRSHPIGGLTQGKDRGVRHKRSRSAGAEAIESLKKENTASGSYVFE